MSHFKETAEDIAVKDRLWRSTEHEALYFAKKEADGFVRGEAYSNAQKDATSAAKSKGYPCGLIRGLGRSIRLNLLAERDDLLAGYRSKIGLDV